MLGISLKTNVPSLLSKAWFRHLCDLAVCSVKQLFSCWSLEYTAFDMFTHYWPNRWIFDDVWMIFCMRFLP